DALHQRPHLEERGLLGGVYDDLPAPRGQLVEGTPDLLHVLPSEPLGTAPLSSGVPEQVGGMEQWAQLDAMPVVPAPTQPGDALGRSQEELGGYVAERADHLRTDHLDLS